MNSFSFVAFCITLLVPATAFAPLHRTQSAHALLSAKPCPTPAQDFNWQSFLNTMATTPSQKKTTLPHLQTNPVTKQDKIQSDEDLQRKTELRAHIQAHVNQKFAAYADHCTDASHHVYLPTPAFLPTFKPCIMHPSTLTQLSTFFAVLGSFLDNQNTWKDTCIDGAAAFLGSLITREFFFLAHVDSDQRGTLDRTFFTTLALLSHALFQNATDVLRMTKMLSTKNVSEFPQWTWTLQALRTFGPFARAYYRAYSFPKTGVSFSQGNAELATLNLPASHEEQEADLDVRNTLAGELLAFHFDSLMPS